jgi:YVTN family beta-propeller protein
MTMYRIIVVAWLVTVGGTGILPAANYELRDAPPRPRNPPFQSDPPAQKPALKVVPDLIPSSQLAIRSVQKKSARPGVATPGVRIPVAKLMPDAVFPFPGQPDWIAVGDHVWVSNSPKGTVARIDPVKNKIIDVIAVGKRPGCGLTIGFGSLWVPCCGDDALRRIDLDTGKITATISTPIASSEGGIAVGSGSVWICTDKKGVLARIDPATNKVVAEIKVSPGSYGVTCTDDRVWVTGTEKSVLACIDPRTNSVVDTTPTGPSPRFLAFGEGAIWTLNQGDGSVSRIDAKTHKVLATIEVGVPGDGGDIAVGDGSVWVTSFDFPLSRIDPSANRVVQQFAGPGGDAVRVGLGSVWLSNLEAGNVWRLDLKKITTIRS